MEQSSSFSSISRRINHHHNHQEPPEFNLKEWGLKARIISRENTNSRRFSASYIRSFREDARSSFRSNFTISSTASSPGYTLRDEIDPSTYSFTTALKALQARSVYGWESMSPDGFALNSKWNEAEKYICNPKSGEVPMECLSAKTLSGRSFRNLTSKITMSAPLVYHSRHNLINMNTTTSFNKPSSSKDVAHFPIQVKKSMECVMSTRDVGTQSTPPDISSSGSPSPTSTPPINERSLNRGKVEETEDSPKSNVNLKFLEQEGEGVKETREEEETKRSKDVEEEEEEEEEKKEDEKSCRCSSSRRQLGGCLSLKSLWTRRRQREKHKPRYYKE